MSKLIGFVLFLVSVILMGGIYGTEEENLNEILISFVEECGKDHGVTVEDFRKMVNPTSYKNIKPCFLACLLRKFELLNDKGEYDVAAGLTAIRRFTTDDAHYAKMSEIGKECAKVNDEPVSDGEAGCERAMLLTICYIERMYNMYH